MDHEVLYKGYLIHPRASQRRDTGAWTRDIRIWRYPGSAIHTLPVTAGGTFETSDEAVADGIRLGRDIIDGKVPGCSVAEL